MNNDTESPIWLWIDRAQQSHSQRNRHLTFFITVLSQIVFLIQTCRVAVTLFIFNSSSVSLDPNLMFQVRYVFIYSYWTWPLVALALILAFSGYASLLIPSDEVLACLGHNEVRRAITLHIDRHVYRRVMLYLILPYCIWSTVYYPYMFYISHTGFQRLLWYELFIALNSILQFLIIAESIVLCMRFPQGVNAYYAMILVVLLAAVSLLFLPEADAAAPLFATLAAIWLIMRYWLKPYLERAF